MLSLVGTKKATKLFEESLRPGGKVLGYVDLDVPRTIYNVA